MYTYTDTLTHMHMPLPHMHTPAQTNMNPYETLHTKVTQTHQTHRTIKQTKKQPNRQTNKGPLHPPNPPPHATLAPPKQERNEQTNMPTCAHAWASKKRRNQRQTDRHAKIKAHTQTDIHLSKQTDGWRGGQADQPRLIDWFSDELTGRTAD